MLCLFYPQTFLQKLKFILNSRLCMEEESKVVSADSMKKPDVLTVYDDGMNGVDVNDQYQSYYPAGSVSQR